MSLSTALNAAISGLTASGRSSALVSDNIANASTPGYVRRTISLGSQLVGAGVRVNGITRHDNPVLIANRRSAEADHAAASTLSDFHTRLTGVVGTTADPYSIAARLASFEGGLIEASSRPDSSIRLDQVATNAVSLASAMNEASDAVQDMRGDADLRIGVLVNELNTALTNLQDVNSRITSTLARGASAASLMDERQRLVDQINEIVPVNVVNRDYGQIAIYSDGGAILLDGQAAEIGFSVTNTVIAGMSVDDNSLSGLTVNGIAVPTDSTRGALRGGLLGASFEVRDELGVSAQSDLDALARDLIERFETPGLDPSLGVGDPGLFTDGGSAFNAANEVGLSARIAVNAAVDPFNGGESWRLRDGLAAAAPGPVGDASLLNAMREVLTTKRTVATGDFGTGAMTAADVSSALHSRFNQRASFADQTLSFATTVKIELQEIEMAQGVDTDVELQNLLRIEQAYAANARVVEVVDELMERLLRI